MLRSLLARSGIGGHQDLRDRAPWAARGSCAIWGKSLGQGGCCQPWLAHPVHGQEPPCEPRVLQRAGRAVDSQVSAACLKSSHLRGVRKGKFLVEAQPSHCRQGAAGPLPGSPWSRVPGNAQAELSAPTS